MTGSDADRIVDVLHAMDDDMRAMRGELVETNRAIHKMQAELKTIQSFLLKHNTTVGELCELFDGLECMKDRGDGRKRRRSGRLKIEANGGNGG